VQWREVRFSRDGCETLRASRNALMPSQLDNGLAKRRALRLARRGLAGIGWPLWSIPDSAKSAGWVSESLHQERPQGRVDEGAKEMGSVFKKTDTKPLPIEAELFEKSGKPFARVKPAKGRAVTYAVTTGKDGSQRIVVEAGTYLAKFRDGSGIVREVSTGCRDEGAARCVLNELERRAELVRSGVITSNEDRVADHQRSSIAEHFEDYEQHLHAKGVTGKHIRETVRYLDRLANDCDWLKLSDLSRESFDCWLAMRRHEQMGARNLNAYRVALVAFANWAVSVCRMTSNPFAAIPKADEKSDRRRPRRALSEVELRILLDVTAQRPLEEALTVRRGKRKGKLTANIKPEDRKRLQALGRERALIYKTLAFTGLRKNELASVTLGQVQLDGATPHIVLNAADEKNREGSLIPLRSDLAADLREWLSDRTASRRLEARNAPTIKFDRKTRSDIRSRSNEEQGRWLMPDEFLFDVPDGLVKIFDRDLRAAGIPKVDDRGRTLDVHSLRTTFGTMLSRSGVAPRSAQSLMRHSTIDLTMNTYTDPRLLDLQGAIEALPTLSLTTTRKDGPEVMRATGTMGALNSQLAPMLAPTFGKPCLLMAYTGTGTEHFVETVSENTINENRANTKQKAPSEGGSDEALLQVAPPGFEPEPTDPESVVLPLHHGAIRATSWMPEREDNGGSEGRQESHLRV